MPHEERNDALKDNNKIALQRYNFAIECFKDRKRDIVDLGSGLGYGCKMLRDAGHTVMGVDNSEEAIEYARKEYPGNYLVVDLNTTIPTLRETGVCFEVLCHLKYPQEFIDALMVKELVISAPILANKNDGYFYRLHTINENEFKNLFKDWRIIKEFRQKIYLTLYLKK